MALRCPHCRKKIILRQGMRVGRNATKLECLSCGSEIVCQQKKNGKLAILSLVVNH